MPQLIGEDPTQLERLNRSMDRALKGHPYVKSAIDMAAWDVLGQAAGMPVCELLGGRYGDDFVLYRAISQDTLAAMAASITGYREEGYRRFQLKVGGDPDVDIERIHASAAALGGGDKLIADANTGWLRHEAMRVAAAVRDVDVCIEQPCASYEECLSVRRHTDRPFVLDESIDGAAGASDAEYFWNQMGCKSIATTHDGSPYAEQLARVAENRFKELGGTVTAAEAVAPTDVDMRPVLTRIATTKPCAVYFPIFVAAAAQIVRQFGEIRGLEDARPIGGSALLAPGFLEAAGDAAVGFVFTNPDTSPDAMGSRYPDLVKKYTEKYGEAPVQAFHQNAYDGMAVALMGIEKEDVAQALGINLVNVKLLAYGLGAGFAGVAGAIFAVMLASIFPHSFQLLISVNVLALLIVGGMGSLRVSWSAPPRSSACPSCCGNSGSTASSSTGS